MCCVIQLKETGEIFFNCVFIEGKPIYDKQNTELKVKAVMEACPQLLLLQNYNNSEILRYTYFTLVL